MADHQPYGYRGKPGTCLWCGRKLRYRIVIVDNDRRGQPGVTWHEQLHYATARADLAGSSADGMFCGLRCGYQFGLRLAELGRRLAFDAMSSRPPRVGPGRDEL